jgi:hypothetical protein
LTDHEPVRDYRYQKRPNETLIMLHNLIIHPDDIPRLPTCLRTEVEEQVYAYLIRIVFESDQAKRIFYLQMSDPVGDDDEEWCDSPKDCCEVSEKWCRWVGDDELIFEIAFSEGATGANSFFSMRERYEGLRPIGFQIAYEVLAVPFVDRVMAETTFEKARRKLTHKNQFRWGTKLWDDA